MTELVALVIAGLAAGYINSIAGAGSLLTLPALIFTGLDAAAANATNRIGVIVQCVSALAALYMRQPARIAALAKPLLTPLASMLIGAVLGAWVAARQTAKTMTLVIAITLVFMWLLGLVRPKQRLERRSALEVMRDAGAGFHLLFFIVGVYAGFIQTGSGIVLLLILANLYGMDIVEANVLKIALISVANVGAIGAFWTGGAEIDIRLGGALAVATSIGAAYGAVSTLKPTGAKLIQTGIGIAVIASAAKLIYDAIVTRV